MREEFIYHSGLKDFPSLKVILYDDVLIGISFLNKDDSILKPLKDSPIKQWLDSYFKGDKPYFDVPYKFIGTTMFQERIYQLIKDIPYGKTRSYSDIAKLYQEKFNVAKMSSQAIGHALNKNPICIYFPCHRIIGKNGSLVGFGGGIDTKSKLLKHENKDFKYSDR